MRYLYEINMNRLVKAEELAKKYECKVSDIAIRYIYSNDMNIYAIMSSTNPKRLINNIKSSKILLNKEEVDYLESNQK